MRRLTVATVALVLALSGCAATGTTGGGAPTGAADGGAPAAGGGAIDSAAALVQQRYDLVKAGDYKAACALYSDQYAVLFEELADSVGKTCVEAHEAAALNVTTYLATAKDQDRAGLTPFFYVPSAIKVDASKISSDSDDVAFLGPGTVISLDTTAFEDGTGKTPGWLNGQDYVKRGADGSWQFIAAVEQ